MASYLDRLPNEIQDIILNMYWQDIYTNFVIKDLNNIETKVNDINQLFNNNLMSKLIQIANNNTTVDNVDSYLLSTNIFFKNLSKPQIKYLSKRYNEIKYIYYDNSENISLPEWCKYAAVYFISLSGYMRYNIYHAFNKINKPNYI